MTGLEFRDDHKKTENDRLAGFLEVLMKEPENKRCAECDTLFPRWASWNLGVFICIRCAGIHRKLGTHISKVKSVNLDSWTAEQVQSMRVMGNARAKEVYEAALPPQFCRPQNDKGLETFVRAKYEQKLYIRGEWSPPLVRAEDLPLHPLNENIPPASSTPQGGLKLEKPRATSSSLIDIQDLVGNSSPAAISQGIDPFSLLDVSPIVTTAEADSPPQVNKLDLMRGLTLSNQPGSLPNKPNALLDLNSSFDQDSPYAGYHNPPPTPAASGANINDFDATSKSAEELLVFRAGNTPHGFKSQSRLDRSKKSNGEILSLFNSSSGSSTLHSPPNCTVSFSSPVKSRPLDGTVPGESKKKDDSMTLSVDVDIDKLLNGGGLSSK